MRGRLYAEFDSPEAILRAATRMRALGLTRLHSITPFHFPELEDEIGARRSRIPFAAFVAGLSAAALMYLVQWWTNAVNYPLNVGGRPLNSVVSNIPLMYETTIAVTGASAFGLMLLLSGLPRLYTPLSEIEGIERTTIDRYWLEIDLADPLYDRTVRGELTALGAVALREVTR